MKHSRSSHPLVVIVGRPNVGKSTLFNRLLGSRRALVHNQPGVTRDRLEQEVTWHEGGRPRILRLVDTGGLGGTFLSAEIASQVDQALQQAAIVLWVMDVQQGLTELEKDLCERWRPEGFHHWVGVLNKVDHAKHEPLVSEFYSLPLAHWVSVSAEHDLGIEDLKALLLQDLLRTFWEKSDTESLLQGPEESDQSSDGKFPLLESLKKEPHRGPPRITLVGRPNVGKSTLLNALFGNERVITSSIPGTTIDAIEVPILLGGQPVQLVDTAGVRRKDRTEQGVEVLSIIQTQKALERSELALLLLDGSQGVVEQDEKIGGLIQEAGCSVILVVNKWDTQTKNWTPAQATRWIRSRMAYLNYAPMIFVSALFEKNLKALAPLCHRVLQERTLRVPTHEFTEWVRRESTIHNPKEARFYLCHQTSQHPPSFVCHVNDPDKVVLSLRRHLVNAIRKRWGYLGTPIRLTIQEAKNRRSLPKPALRGAPSAGKTSTLPKKKRPLTK